MFLSLFGIMRYCRFPSAARLATSCQRVLPPCACISVPRARWHGVLRTLAPGTRVSFLNKQFGAVVCGEAWKVSDVLRQDIGSELRQLWLHSGLVAIRGITDLTPQHLVAFTQHFGRVSSDVGAGREFARVAGLPVLRLGNVRDSAGRLTSVLSATTSLLPENGSCQYRPADRQPVWHTDGLFSSVPPAGSVLFCRQAPSVGATTCFSDMVGAWASLEPAEQMRLAGLEAVCSQAHHDAKIRRRVPEYPVLSAAERSNNPARYVPVALDHPITGRRALSGINSGTCAVVPRGTVVSAEDMIRYDNGVEDTSVSELRSLLPRVTSPQFTVSWQWQPGDLVVWDNRSTLHCGTGYDHRKYVREMWRTTISP